MKPTISTTILYLFFFVLVFIKGACGQIYYTYYTITRTYDYTYSTNYYDFTYDIFETTSTFDYSYTTTSTFPTTFTYQTNDIQSRLSSAESQLEKALSSFAGTDYDIPFFDPYGIFNDTSSSSSSDDFVPDSDEQGSAPKSQSPITLSMFYIGVLSICLASYMCICI